MDEIPAETLQFFIGYLNPRRLKGVEKWTTELNEVNDFPIEINELIAQDIWEHLLWQAFERDMLTDR